MADLDSIKPPATAPATSPDPLVEKEVVQLEERRQEAEIASLEQDTAARKTYANRIYCLAVFWLLGVLAILLIQGFGLWGTWKPLPDNVLIALVAGSTTGVLGILASVIAYIFRVPR